MSGFAGSIRGRFATRWTASRPLRLLCVTAVVAGGLALGCRIAPVVSDTQVGTSNYDDCERASENYCERVVGATDAELEKCVAKYAFQCISGSSD